MRKIRSWQIKEGYPASAITRTNNSIRNVTISMLLGFLALIATFVAQRVFINYLNIEYLGINGLFKNIISMLAIAEVGMGSAIAYHMYKPLRENDTQKIRALLSFYKNGYRVIALIVLGIGLIIMPFLPLIVGKTTVTINLYFVFLIFIADAVFSYFMSYKRSVIFADQKNYIIDTVRVGSLITLSIIQILILVMTQNYYLYLLIKVVMTVAENVALNTMVNKMYPRLRIHRSKSRPLDVVTKRDIYKKMKGLLYHSTGTFFVLSTDNIVISVFFGIGVVGLYSNYLLILSAIGSMSWLLTTAITASIGNLLLTNDKSKHFEVFNKVHFGNFWISTVVTVAFFVAVDSFIAVWLGTKFIFPLGILAALSFNLFLTLSRVSFYSFKTAAGIFHEDRYVPIIESVINLVSSLILLHFFGLAGVFLGTICSTLILHLFSYPKFVYKPLFKQNYSLYYREFFKYTFVVFFVAGITFAISRSIIVGGNFATFTFNILLCLIVPNAILFIIFRNNTELAFYRELAYKSLKSIKKTS